MNITNKPPALDNTEKLVCTPPKALHLQSYAGFVTGKMTPEENGRRRLRGEKRFSLKSSFTTNQSYERVPHDKDESPKFKAVQDSSACI